MSNLEQSIAEWRQQMAAGGIKSSAALDELENHLREHMARQLCDGVTEQQAFESAVRHVGAAGNLSAEFCKVDQAKEDEESMNHNRVYSAVLVIFGVYNLVIVVASLVLLQMAGGRWDGPMGHAPAWTLPWLFALTCAYTLFILVTLCARHFRPETGRRLTRALNWALLPALPGGTVIGLYGLWAARKGNSQYV